MNEPNITTDIHPGDGIADLGRLTSGLMWILIQLGPGKRALEENEGQHYILRVMPKGTQTSLVDDHELLLLSHKLALGIQNSQDRMCRLAVNLGLATAKDYFHIHIYAVRRSGVKVMRLLDSIVRKD